MQFIKKVILLKQITTGFSTTNKTVSGIFRLETENGVTDAYLSLINLRSVISGEYYLGIINKKGSPLFFSLGARPTFFNKNLENALDIEKGFSAGLIYIENFLPTVVAFGKTEDSETTISEFKKTVADKCIYDKKAKEKEPPEIKPTIETEQIALTDCPTVYDDEAVATENYFSLDDDLKNKLTLIKDIDNELLRAENERADITVNAKAQEKSDGSHGNENEGAFDSSKKYSKDFPYYLTVQRELDEIFNKFPEEQSLTKTFPDSKWAVINYSSEKHYVVGVIKEDGKEKYICYGVPSNYSETPPKELDGYCSFIPLSIFDLKGKGYWIMFQSAETGNCIKTP